MMLYVLVCYREKCVCDLCLWLSCFIISANFHFLFFWIGEGVKVVLRRVKGQLGLERIFHEYILVGLHKNSEAGPDGWNLVRGELAWNHNN